MMTAEDLRYLAMSVPPQLEQAIGYEGEARFVAFYWTPHGDEAMFDDGRHGGTGDWDGYLAFIQHPAVALVLQGVALGDSDSEASHWLVLHRQTRQLFVAPELEARRFLHQQWPQPEASAPVTMTSRELQQQVLDALNVQNWQGITPLLNQEEVVRRVQEHAQLVQDMKAFLDQFLIPLWEMEGDGGAGL